MSISSDKREDALGVIQDEASRRGERDSAVTALEKARIELLFELLHLKGDRRLRHEKLLRRLGEGELLRYGVEDLKAAVGHLEQNTLVCTRHSNHSHEGGKTSMLLLRAHSADERLGRGPRCEAAAT